MGALYRARDRATGDLVAIKVAHPSTQVAARFHREVRALAHLQHPSVVRYVAHGLTEAGSAYLVMEWLDGFDLDARLERGPLGVGDTLGLAEHVARALGAAHAAGLIHRDVKPANLFLVGGAPERVKVLDFGMVRLGVSASATRTGTLLGTPAYMAPEQARGEGDVDARADVYALGAVMYECLTGRPPFFASTLMAVLAKLLIEEVPRVRAIDPEVTPELDALIARMLSKDRRDRPENGAAVALAIAALRAEPIRKPVPEVLASSALSISEKRLTCAVLVGEASVYERSGQTPDASEAEAVKIATSLGAEVQALSDGSLVATLVGRGGRVNHNVLAARCALALKRCFPERPVALTLGRAIPGERLEGSALVTRARQLLSEALHPSSLARSRAPSPVTPGEMDVQVHLDERLAGLLDHRFEVTGSPSGPVLREELETPRPARALLGRDVRCVGREREIDRLLGLFEECASEPMARAALVLGPAGIGKSRLYAELVRELARRGAAIEVLMTSGDPAGAGAPCEVLASALPLHARVGIQTLQPGTADAGEQVQSVFEGYLRSACAVRPVLLVLDDLQWCDAPTVSSIDAVLRHLHDRPFFVLALGRPEVREIFPRLWADRDLHVMRLSDLPRRASERLARQVLGDAVPEAIVGESVTQAAGNPFYLEEFIRAVASGRSTSLPDAVLAMVELQLDAVDAEARRVLRAASVFGERFWEDGVAALLGICGLQRPEPIHLGGARGCEASPVEEQLQHLTSVEILSSCVESAFPEHSAYTFRNPLLRAAVYATLTDEDRCLGHRLAGEWLEEAGEEDPRVLAEHFDHGQVPQQATVWYRNAAERALTSNDFAAAIQHAESAVRCGAEGQVRGALMLLQAEALGWLGDFVEAAQRSAGAMDALPRGSALWCVAAGELATASGKVGAVKRLLALSEVFLAPGGADPFGAQAIAFSLLSAQLVHAGHLHTAGALLARLDRAEAQQAPRDPAVVARIHQARAVWALASDDPSAHLRWTEHAITCLERSGDARGACDERVKLGAVWTQFGAHEEAERALRSALSTAEHLRLRSVRAHARLHLGAALAGLGNADAALVEVRLAASEALSQSDRQLQSRAQLHLALILTAAGALTEGELAARAAVGSAGAMLPLYAHAQSALSCALHRQGRAGEALTAAAEAMRVLQDLGRVTGGEALIRLVYAQTLHAAGVGARASEEIDVARTRLLARAARITDRSLRHAFLDRVPEHAHTLSLASAWTGRGEPSRDSLSDEP
ncbi:serine/threonine-protein kinase [Chondromyces apiculatus]|nr:serine/threonine-protein kinase [Chondromyces apiculatus]